MKLIDFLVFCFLLKISLAQTSSTAKQSACDTNLRKRFEDWKKEFNITYSSPEEEAARREVFCRNARRVRSSTVNATYTTGENAHSDRTNEERNNNMLGASQRPPNLPTTPAPDSPTTRNRVQNAVKTSSTNRPQNGNGNGKTPSTKKPQNGNNGNNGGTKRTTTKKTPPTKKTTTKRQTVRNTQVPTTRVGVTEKPTTFKWTTTAKPTTRTIAQSTTTTRSSSTTRGVTSSSVSSTNAPISSSISSTNAPIVSTSPIVTTLSTSTSRPPSSSTNAPTSGVVSSTNAPTSGVVSSTNAPTSGVVSTTNAPTSGVVSSTNTPTSGVVSSTSTLAPLSTTTLGTTARPIEIVQNTVLSGGTLPASLNYTADCTPAKDQYGCGSCWAFSAVAIAEYWQNRNRKQYKTFSEQDVLDCNIYGDDCNGGWASTALDYMKTPGIADGNSYVYERQKGQCRNPSVYPPFLKVNNYCEEELFGNETRLMEIVQNYGPTSVVMQVLDNLYSYRSGIYYDPTCPNIKYNHAVTIVGWGTDATATGPKDYWIIKNSWGPTWGQNGYGWLARNQNNHCAISTWAIFLC